MTDQQFNVMMSYLSGIREELANIRVFAYRTNRELAEEIDKEENDRASLKIEIRNQVEAALQKVESKVPRNQPVPFPDKKGSPKLH